MQQELTNFCQFLYHVTPVVIFQVKKWPYSTFYCFAHRKLVSTLLKNNLAFYLVIIQRFLNFPPIPRIRSAERIGNRESGILRNRRKFLNLEDLPFSFTEVLKALL